MKEKENSTLEFLYEILSKLFLGLLLSIITQNTYLMKLAIDYLANPSIGPFMRIIMIFLFLLFLGYSITFIYVTLESIFFKKKYTREDWERMKAQEAEEERQREEEEKEFIRQEEARQAEEQKAKEEKRKEEEKFKSHTYNKSSESIFNENTMNLISLIKKSNSFYEIYENYNEKNTTNKKKLQQIYRKIIVKIHPDKSASLGISQKILNEITQKFQNLYSQVK